MKKIIGLLFITVILTGFIGLQITVLNRVLKQSKDLTTESGIITSIQKIKIPKRYVGYNFAYALQINSSKLRFSIHQNNARAYEYLERNNVINRRVNVLYDKNGYNSEDDLTYHVYSLSIGNRHLLDIQESRKTDKFGLIVFLISDLFIIWMIFYGYRKKKQLSTTR